MLALIALVATTPLHSLWMSSVDGGGGDEWWTSFLSPAGIKDLVETGGLVVLAWALLTNKIITEKMHQSRVDDLKGHHSREIGEKVRAFDAMVEQKDRSHDQMVAAKDEAYAEMKDSRDYYRQARLDEKDRADRATDQLAESNEIARAATHALVSLNQIASEGTSG